MAGTNNFLVFNEANNPNNTMSDADYLADLYRLNGLIPMIADPNAHNKMFRQWSIMVTALANIIASMNYNASDSNLSTLETNLKSAIEDVAEAKVDSRISTLENWKDDITATTTELNYSSGLEGNIQQQINSISGSLATPFPAWIKSTSYAVGDICICTGFDSYKYLECVEAGTTATTPPSNANVGQLVTDNEIKWLVCDWRDSNPVGTIKQDLVVRDGYLMLNGQGITVADYPRLVNFLNDNNFIFSYSDSQSMTNDQKMVSFYYYTPDHSVLHIPDYGNLFIQCGTSLFNKINAGLPNITGSFKQAQPGAQSNYGYTATSGAFTADEAGVDKLSTSVLNATTNRNTRLIFDASASNSIYGNSSTVQPPAVQLIPIIKY